MTDPMPPSLNITALPGIPLVQAGDDLVQLTLDALQRRKITLQDHDVLVISSKIVSKAEGRKVDLSTVTPRPEAIELAEETRKDPRIVELVLQESTSISRKAPGVMVVQHRLGFVSANAGIDQSNVEGNIDFALLMPLDPDGTAQAIRERLKDETDADVGIIISDSHGRPFRLGNMGVAIGVAGMPALLDLKGDLDLFGYELKISIQAYADLVASAANLLSGEGAEGLPVILVRGLDYSQTDGSASDLYRPPERDLYR